MSGKLKLEFVLEAIDNATAKVRAVREATEKASAPFDRMKAGVRDVLKEAQFDKVTDSINTVRERTGSLVGTVKQLAFWFGAATAASGAMFTGLKGAIDKVDRQNDVAKKLGMATSQFQRMGYAAQLNGANEEEMGGALQFLSQNMVEAINGSKDATLWFSRVGISLAQLHKMNAAQVFEQIADVFAKVGDGGQNAAKKIAVMRALMGRGGAELKQVLDLGSKGLREFYGEADKMGATLDDATTGAMADFNDNFDRLRYSIFGVVAQIAKFALPALDAMVKRFTDMNVTQRMEWGQKFGRAVGTIIEKLPGFMTAIGQIGGGMAWAAEKADAIAQALGGWDKVMKLAAVLVGFVLAGKVLMLGLALVDLVVKVRTFMALLAPLGIGLGAVAWPVTAVLALVAGTALLIVYWDELIAKAKELEAAMPKWLTDRSNWLIPSLADRFNAPTVASGKPVASALPAAPGPYRPELGGTLKIEIDANGQPRVRELTKKPGGLLNFDVDLGVPMVAL